MMRYIRLAGFAAAAAMLLLGCRGNMCENVVWEHMFNRPDCRPRPCPRECPEFDLPPGGPYLSTPGMQPVKQQVQTEK